jgi:hypothetical protein
MMENDVFVSYSHPDKASADAACATLEQAGIRCWIAPRDTVPGMDWSESIINAIEGAKVFVLIFSTDANVLQQIKREVEWAVNKGAADHSGQDRRRDPEQGARIFHFYSALARQRAGDAYRSASKLSRGRRRPLQARDAIQHSCQRSPQDATTWCRITYGGSSGWVPDGFLERQN